MQFPTTNVTASGNNLVTITVNNSQSSSAASNISINGNAINFSSANTLSSTITAINNAAIGDIVASANTDGNLQLVSSSGADIIIASCSWYILHRTHRCYRSHNINS